MTDTQTEAKSQQSPYDMIGGAATVRQIVDRFYDGVAATGRWGIGHSAGVIYVSTHPAGTDPAPPSWVLDLIQ